MNLTRFSLRNPYTVLALVLVVVALGGFAFFRTPTDLFPDTVPPQVAVVTVWPGASAHDVADKITEIVEKELNTLSGLKRVTSTSRDEVSAISAEFLYSKPIGEAVLDVQNALSRVRASLPTGILDPRIYKVTDATRPLVTLALTPAPGSHKTLAEIRLLAENEIEDRILGLPGIADVDVFGAHEPEVQVLVDRDRLAAHSASLGEVLAAVAGQNVSAPAGTIYSGAREYLVRVSGEFRDLEAIRALAIRGEGSRQLRVRDVAEVTLGEHEQRSIYHGNGEAAVAVNAMRPDRGPTVAAIHELKALLPRLRADYPDVVFTITDDQQPIIDLNIHGMRSSLIQAVLLTVLVIFVFLADVRAAVVVSVSIPLAFLGSLVVLWFSPYTMNMVTLSGLIIAVGMVVDASIVVLENIYRRYQEMAKPDARVAAREGTEQVSLAVTAGMFTTVIVLIPVMFTGGYTQQVMRPLNLMISATLVGSLLVALTVVPLLAARLLARPRRGRSLAERIFARTELGVEFLRRFYVAILRRALRWRVLTLILAVLLFGVTIRVVKPLIGGELMPPMDTGIVIVEFTTPGDASPPEVERVLGAVEGMIQEQPGVESISSVVGSEPGQISFGGGGATVQSARITVNLVDRTRRAATIWDIEDRWRESLRRLPGIRDFRVSEYGATPLSTTRAPLDVILSGPDGEVLERIAGQVEDALRGLPGAVDLRRSWYRDKREIGVEVDPDLARDYGTDPAAVARELQAAVQGVPASMMRLEGYLDIPILVRYAGGDVAAPEQLRDAYVSSRFGPVPLRALAHLAPDQVQPFVTREDLQPTLDVTAGNRVYTIGQVGKMAQERLAGLEVPAGYSVRVAGTVQDMAEGAREMGGALRIGFVLLYILLVAMFRSFRHPLTIMIAIPLAIAGAMWGLLVFDKPMCKPATMGMILLGGTIVNNSILLLDFILAARREGMSKEDAILQAVRLRIRPILMTTVSTIVGLTPLILELAVGLERMSPLGIVAAFGLLVGTFLTMVVVPVTYSGLDSLATGAARLGRALKGAPDSRQAHART